MLDKIDPKHLLNAAHQRGFARFELYYEKAYLTRCRSLGGLVRTNSHHWEGLSLRAWKGQLIRQFNTGNPTVESIFDFFESTSPSVLPAGSGPWNGAHTVESRLHGFIEFAKGLKKNTSFDYSESKKYFQVFNESGSLERGIEESATIEQGSSGYRQLRHTQQIQPFLEAIEKDDTFWENAGGFPMWPCPKGKILILWSHRVVAKLILCLLRAFEGDLVLSQKSFLCGKDSHWELPFNIEESPSSHLPSSDNEGSSRRTFTFYKDGKIRGLACDRWIADQMGVSPTGHSRRKSYLDSPAVCMWSPRVEGIKKVEDIQQNLFNGIRIDNIEILKWDPQLTSFKFRLSSAFLVHQKQRGEKIEPIVVECDLVKLLGATNVFSYETQSICLPVNKKNQEFIVQLHVPQAISESFDLPGTVPKSHYW